MFLLTQNTHRMLIRHDPDVGHTFVPNLRARIPGEDGGYLVVTNSLGFRSDFEFSTGSSGSPRILMFGDSYTAGDNVANQDRYSDQLAALTGAEVQNYGVPGTGTDQHLLIYRKFARDIDADLVVICVQIDSFHRIQLSHRPAIDRITGRRLLVPKPYFELEGGQLQLRQVPVPTERPVDESRPDAPDKHHDSWVSGVLKWYNRVPGLRELRHSTPVKELGDRLVSELYRVRSDQPYEDITSADTPGWKLMEAILRQFVGEVLPTPVLIVPIPTKEFYVHGVKPIYQDLFNTLDNPDSGVHVADVSTPLVRLPWSERQELRYEQGGHFTPKANRLVAGYMADAISERRLLAAPSLTETTPAAAPASALPPRTASGRHVLGISCFYHNSAAALIRDGEIVAAAEEERFTRLKHDRRFPQYAINYCLEEAGIRQSDLDAVVFYDNSALTFERLCHSVMAVDRDDAERMWMRIMPSWLRLKLHFPALIRDYLHYDGPILQGVHHRSHAASCFFPSPFEKAAILTVDGVGEWATASIGRGEENRVQLLKEMRFPHSLGLLYSAFTQFTGFKVNSGEYKMMGLAPYGEPVYAQKILDNIVDLKDDGSLELNMEYFSFLRDVRMTSPRFDELFDGPRRNPDSRITRREIDISRSIQAVTEEAVLRMAKTASSLTGEANLCLAGGVALNCVANGRLLREGPYRDLWIQPAAGDAGCALGAALDVWHTRFGGDREPPDAGVSPQGGSYLGPDFSEDEIRSFLDTFGYPYRHLPEEERQRFLAGQLEEGKVVGHFAGRLEYGPRALGARSILGDPRNREMQTELNLRIKYRESFRPFAPSVLSERVGEYFELDRESPYMLIVAPVAAGRRLPLETELGEDDDLLAVVRRPRSDLPAITHVDYSARIQSVRREHHPVYYGLIEEFARRTGCGVVVNTSFNVRGEPIVCTPQDAYRCFMRTEMDVLALGNFVLLKPDQPEWPEGKGEGLENEDIAVSEPEEHPEKLLADISKIFSSEFWPVAEAVRQDGSLLVSANEARRDSVWSDAAEPADLSALFTLPDALVSRPPEPERAAESLTSGWLAPDVAKRLRPAIAKLIAAGLEHPVEADLGEEVSESVYVMF